MRKLITAVFLLTLVQVPCHASATPLTYVITGTINSFLHDPFVGVSAGDTFVATFTVDTSTPNASTSAYSASYLPTSWSLVVGSLSASETTTALSGDGIGRGGTPGSYLDYFQFRGQQDNRGGIYDTVQVTISFWDNDEINGLFDPSLLTSPSQFTRYETTEFSVEHYGYIDNGQYSYQLAKGIVTSIQVVPEPSAPVLLLVGVIALAGWRALRHRPAACR